MRSGRQGMAATFKRAAPVSASSSAEISVSGWALVGRSVTRLTAGRGGGGLWAGRFIWQGPVRVRGAGHRRRKKGGLSNSGVTIKVCG